MHAGELDEKKKQALENRKANLKVDCSPVHPCSNQGEKVRRNDQIWRLCSFEMKQPINIQSKVDESIDFSAIDPTFWGRSDKFSF